MNVAPYRKLVAALAAALGVAASAAADGSLDSTEAIAVVLAFLGAIGVYRLSNESVPSVGV